MIVLLTVAALLVLLARGALALYRFAALPAEAKANYPAMIWSRLRWRWLCRALGLAWADQHRKSVFALGALLSSRSRIRTAADDTIWLRWPKGKFAPDSWGWTCTMKAIPKSTREDLEKVTQPIADAWKCHRVSVSQPAPGKVVLRGLRRDPLAEPYGCGDLRAWDGENILLGRDEQGTLRYASLANIAGGVIAGNPGRGKSAAANMLACQFAPRPTSEWWICDGADGADWSPWIDRAERYCGASLPAARDLIEDCHASMESRLRTLRDDLGVSNAWHVGVSPDYPMKWIVVDESAVYLDIDSIKSQGKEAVEHALAIRARLLDMARRGRKVMFVTLLLAQKSTSTSIPADLRDVCQLRMSFGLTTTDAAVAALGDDIRDFPSFSPTGLQEDCHVGVACARIRTGTDPFTRIRVPYVTEGQALAVARKFSERKVPA